MPEMTGQDLVREVLALRADTPVIMLTGFSHLVDADKAKAADIRAFAMKPITKRELAMREGQLKRGVPALSGLALPP